MLAALRGRSCSLDGSSLFFLTHSQQFVGSLVASLSLVGFLIGLPTHFSNQKWEIP